GVPQIVSVVSAKAQVEGNEVSLGTALGTPLALLQAELVAGKGVYHAPGLEQKTVSASDRRRTTGAKFVKP
ncbi:MAG: S1 family peptidase, partial [Sulfitobacter sp.]|nr:S1 family peptidase [Sulfitobacter sp.]